MAAQQSVARVGAVPYLGALRVVAVPETVAASYTVLGWIVDDIAQTVDGPQTRGVDFERFEGMQQDERGVWEAPGGDLVAWFKDPDANTLSLTELAPPSGCRGAGWSSPACRKSNCCRAARSPATTTTIS